MKTQDTIWEKKSANHVSDERLLSRTCTELSDLIIVQSNGFLKGTGFDTRDTQVANKHM